MNVTVVFGSLADFEHFFLGNGTALAGFYQVSGKVTKTDAAVILDLTGALAIKTTGIAAGTVSDGELSVILVQPVGNVFDGDRLVYGIYCLLHGNDMHANPVAAGGDQVGFPLQREEGHLIEALGEFGIFFNLIQNHVCHLGNAGDKQLHIPLLLVPGILPVIFHDAMIGGIGQKLHDARFRLAGELRDLRGSLRLTKAHLQHDFRDLVIGTCAVENDIFRVFFGQPLNAELVGKAVGNHFTEIKQDFSCHGFPLSVLIMVF